MSDNLLKTLDTLYDEIHRLRQELKAGRIIVAAVISKFGTNDEIILSDHDIYSISPNDYIECKPPTMGHETTYRLVRR